jgi:fructoselysine-6-P-deglycase FrlB-like protein
MVVAVGCGGSLHPAHTKALSINLRFESALHESVHEIVAVLRLIIRRLIKNQLVF